MSYGLPYMGSKNAIAHKIIECLPKTENFYDLFCGGCSITECAILSKKWKNIYFNDIDGEIPKLFLNAIHGKYQSEKEWISREEFLKRKDNDAYVRLCWSFGNSGKTYLYSKEIEPFKKAYWYAIFFDDFSLFWKLGINIPKVKAKNYKAKRLAIKTKLKKIYTDTRLQSLQSLESLERLQRLQSLESLERLQSLERLERLEMSSKSYDEVSIKENSIVYCDIPYENTAEYTSGSFNHKKFYDWAFNQKELVVISSYEISDDRFQRVINFKKVSLLNNAVKSKKKKKEGLFVAKNKIELWKKLKENK